MAQRQQRTGSWVRSCDEGRRARGECAGVGCGANVRRFGAGGCEGRKDEGKSAAVVGLR